MNEFSSMTIGDFLRQAASDAPTPGGGAIAALVGALGGSMASMAANFTLGKPKYAEHDAFIRETLATIAPLIDDLRKAVDDDAEAFAGISQAYARPKGDEAEKAKRKEAIDAALTASMRVPLRVARRCGEAAALLPELARRGNANLLSDVDVAGIMLTAASRAALVNIYANSSMLRTAEARDAEAEGERLSCRVQGTGEEVADIIRTRR